MERLSIIIHQSADLGEGLESLGIGEALSSVKIINLLEMFFTTKKIEFSVRVMNCDPETLEQAFLETLLSCEPKTSKVLVVSNDRIYSNPFGGGKSAEIIALKFKKKNSNLIWCIWEHESELKAEFPIDYIFKKEDAYLNLEISEYIKSIF